MHLRPIDLHVTARDGQGCAYMTCYQCGFPAVPAINLPLIMKLCETCVKLNKEVPQ